MKKIELLAPAGTKDAFYAAVNNGADAVYIGGKKFGARSFANNFTNEEIEELIFYAHVRDVKVYVVINTIVFDSEWFELTEFLDFLYKTDVDALIVQDLGVMEYITTYYPSFIIHASTQVNVHTVSQAKMLTDFNVKRIVLAREVNLELAQKIKDETKLEIEVFAHGALCVSYSGNCLMSSLIGKRSGNRGRCAQPCRMRYRISDELESKFYISTRDLMTLEYLDQIIESGIDSLKIEGRMKSVEYVALTTKIYRQAIDAYYQGEEIDLEKAIFELSTAFNRQFTKGYLLNDNDENITNIDTPNHQGVLLGKVINVSDEYIKIKTFENLSVGDSIRIVGKNIFGFTISKMKNSFHQKITTTLANSEVFILSDKKCSKGDEVYLTKSFTQIVQAKESLEPNYRKIPISATIKLKDNKLSLTINDGKNMVEILSQSDVQKATNQNLTNDRIIDQINKPGQMPYEFDQITLDLPFIVFLPIKEINQVRRSALESLSLVRSKWHQRMPKATNYQVEKVKHEDIKPTIKAKVRTIDQLKAVIETGFKEIYVSDQELIDKFHRQYPKVRFIRYIDRINQIMYNDSKLAVTANIGYLGYDNVEVSSTYLNIVNSYAVYYLLKKNIKVVGLSHELSKNQIQNLIYNFKARYGFIPNLELNCYAHQEMMILRHDVLNKNNITNEETSLIDQKNYSFPIIKENQVTKILNSKRLHLLDYLDEIKKLPINSCYIEFTVEDYEESKKIARMYIEKYQDEKESVTTIENWSYGHFRDGVL